MHALLAVALWVGIAAEARASGEHRLPDLRQADTPRSRPGVRLRLPLTVHVATTADRPLLNPWWLKQALAKTNDELAAHGIEVYVARVTLMPEGFAEIRGRRDRRRLANFAAMDGTVHVFLVQTVEFGSGLRTARTVRGLHWRAGTLRSRLRDREYLVIGGDAPTTTLAHELGHLFGLQHDTRYENLMCSCREGPRQIFTRAQGLQLWRGVTAFMRRVGRA